MTQAERNPYKYSDSNKRYQTFEYYCRHTFGGKCARISLDGGFTCPNIDGTVSTGGCIYCLGGSSGAHGETLTEQYRRGVEIAKRKWDVTRFIPYLQAHTNTYAPIGELRRVYRAAAALPDAVMLAIATRADCLSDETVALLAETARNIPVTVELGLQTADDRTAALINRGHTYADFLAGYEKLRRINVKLGVHLIFGLPGENRADMLATVKKVAALRPDSVKIHLLYVPVGTRLGEMYLSGEYTPIDRREYIETAAEALTLLAPETVIGRLTGDAPDGVLLAPDWCRRKTAVLNDIDKLMFERNIYQGCAFSEE